MKESFDIVYKRNFAEHNLTINESMFLWDDICTEITERHNFLNVHDKIEEYFEFKLDDFDISDLPVFITKYIGSSSTDWDNLFTKYYDDFSYDLEVLEAGFFAGIDLDSIEESYVGQNDSDADFAERSTRELFDFKDVPSWVEIDWDATSVNFMYDYTEHNGHYFSNY